MASFFWHNLSIEDTLKLLGSDFKNGLSFREISDLQRKFGRNQLPEEKPLSRLRIILDQFKNPLIYILLAAGIVTLFLKETTDAIVIFSAVVLNTVIGYVQESKASKTLIELKKMVKNTAKTVRDGNIKLIDSLEVVPGDIIVFNPGDKVTADGRIIESHGLKVNEMALTGEWLPSNKKIEILTKETSLADRDNMAYMGTVVEDGKGKMVVTETGSQTEIGKIAQMVTIKDEPTPIQSKILSLTKTISLFVGLAAFLIFVEGIFTGNSFLEMFTTSIAVAVATIPEGLPMAFTIVLALGMTRILKRQGLVRKLVAAETLGGTTIIAVDKTCTLTEGVMKVAEIFTLDGKISSKKNTLKAASLCSEAFIENPKDNTDKWRFSGRPTDKALLKEALNWGLKKEEMEEKVDEISFDSNRKYSASLNKASKNSFNLYVLGSPERIFSFSNITPEERKKANKALEEFAGKGQRIVAAAFKRISKFKPGVSKLEGELKDLNFAGLISLVDPLRADAKEAIENCVKAGLKPIIITGDHKLTTKNMALDLGFDINDENIIEGRDLEMLSDKEFEKRIGDIKVYARVEPKHKLRIIEAWQRKGAVVAMTGDGINDAPALKKADIGIALGSGTEVAKETSDLILLNDSFSIILAAIEEGRAIIDNIRKVITYLLSSSFSEVILIGGALVAGLPLPLIPAQILWINLVEDGLPDTALAFEPKEKDLMKQKPKGKEVSLLTKEMKVIIFIIGIVTDFILLGLFLWLWNKGHEISYIRTMIFSCLTMHSLFYAFSCKSLRKNLWHINIFSNRLLLIAVFFGFFMLLAAVYAPFFNTLLQTVPLMLNDWIIVLSLTFIDLFFIEMTKWYFIAKKK